MSDLETALSKPLRLILVLGKFRVSHRQNNQMKIELGGSTTMTCNLPEGADVKAGDLLTFYTEVFYANPQPPPIQ